MNALGVLRGEHGDTWGAIEALGHAVAISPDRPLIQTNLAEALMRAGQYDRARCHLQHALDVAASAAGPDWLVRHARTLMVIVDHHLRAGQRRRRRTARSSGRRIQP